MPTSPDQRSHTDAYASGLPAETKEKFNCPQINVRNNSESLFKSMKYGPMFPDRFASRGDERAFSSSFVGWHNHHNRHSGIGFHTPANVHCGVADEVA